MKIEVDLIDIGGNFGSISRCLDRLGVRYKKINSSGQLDGDQLDGSRPIILPGVGAFGAVMQHLQQNGLAETIEKHVNNGTPILGLCVGHQVLFAGSMESPQIAGLNLLPGKVVKFKHGKIPQIGWNKITPTKNGGAEEYVYFVNSFYACPEEDEMVSYTANYYGKFCAAVSHRNITAFQFHPEKSGAAGERLLRRWLTDVE